MAIHRPTAVLTADRLAATESRDPKVRVVGGSTDALNGVRALLSQALVEARAVDESLVAYFIEMAIAEASATSAVARPELVAGGAVSRSAG